MSTKLSEIQKLALQQNFVLLKSSTDLAIAKHAMDSIQRAFINQRSHYRLLQAKLYYYEILLNAGKTDDAVVGFEAIHLRANKGTRTFLESSAFLGICYLRTQKIEEAKTHIRVVIENTKDIKSDLRREQFYRRLIARVEEECILSQLIGRGQPLLDAVEVHQLSIDLVKKSESELLESIGNALPVGTQSLMTEVSSYSINLLPVSDQKRLPAPTPEIPKTLLGKKALAALKRIGWKSFCDKSSNIFKLWNKGIPKVFSEGYFSLAVVTTLNEWKIGLPQLAAGIAATAMRFGCAEFCSQFKPEALMIPKTDKS
ncbi:MAG: hypothetical protein EOP06_11085 [Proteobacteria bacterium]|nr:MAG: hypothetical protein EOP06_11085 [Pseudomonadota bacterium]